MVIENLGFNIQYKMTPEDNRVGKIYQFGEFLFMITLPFR